MGIVPSSKYPRLLENLLLSGGRVLSRIGLGLVVYPFVLQENSQLLHDKVWIEKAVTEKISYLQRHKVHGMHWQKQPFDAWRDGQGRDIGRDRGGT